MPAALKPHPDCAPVPAIRVEAEAERPEPDRLILRYRLTGDLGALLMPGPRPPGPEDGLWRHTCLEAFVGAVAEPGYVELNFSPSGQWAAYAFSGYRARAAKLELAPPEIEARKEAACYAMTASIRLDSATGLPADRPWQLGLAAVIETKESGLSYWAVAHPSGQPDFHRRDCFAVELPPPDRA